MRLSNLSQKGNIIKMKHCPGPGEDGKWNCSCLAHRTPSGFCGGCRILLRERIEEVQSGELLAPTWFKKSWMKRAAETLSFELTTEQAVELISI